MTTPARPHNDAPRERARPEPGLHEALRQSAIDGRRQELLRAKAFARIDASNAYVFHGCASIGEYGVRIGYGSQQAQDYAAAGRVIAAVAQAEGFLLDGSMCISTLAILEPLFRNPDLRFTDDDGTPWTDARILAWARLRTDRALRRAIRRREAEVRTGERTRTRTLHLTAQGAEDLERTQELLSRKERRFVSQSEAAEQAFREYVARHDLLEKPARARRAAPMPPRDDGMRNPRYVPAEVRRALMAGQRDACAIQACTHRIWLENTHHRPHALGGGNELVDQDRLCVLHHRMKDHGEIVYVPAEPGGEPAHYRTREGVVLRLRSPAPNDATCGGERRANGHVGAKRDERASNSTSRRNDLRPEDPKHGASMVREHGPRVRCRRGPGVATGRSRNRDAMGRRHPAHRGPCSSRLGRTHRRGPWSIPRPLPEPMSTRPSRATASAVPS